MSNKLSSGTTHGVVNGVSVGSASMADVLPNYNIYIGAWNSSGTAANFTIRNCAFVTIGAGLTSDQTRALNNIVEEFNDTLGRGVQ